jgi:hypothetical protein
MDHLNEFLLNEYLDQALDEAARRRVEAHLARCPRCRAHLDDLRIVFDALGLPDEKPLGRDLAPGILARLPRRSLSPGWRVALAIQAGVALGVLVTLVRPLAALLRPQLSPVDWAKAVQWIPAFHWPEMHLKLPVVYSFSLPLSAPAALIALLVVLILWGLGNARLLGIRQEVRR